MKKRLVATPAIRLSVVEEKKAQLSYLREESDYAVSVFTNAINKIKDINSKITTTSQEIDSTIEELTRTNLDLHETAKANQNLISKFEALLA
jgi:hypothetical protein